MQANKSSRMKLSSVEAYAVCICATTTCSCDCSYCNCGCTGVFVSQVNRINSNQVTGLSNESGIEQFYDQDARRL